MGDLNWHEGMDGEVARMTGPEWVSTGPLGTSEESTNVPDTSSSQSVGCE